MARRKVLLVTVLSVLLLSRAVNAQTRTVAMTVDDLPFVSGSPSPLTPADGERAMQVNQVILGAFTRDHIPATGFVIERHIQQLGTSLGNKILNRWTQPGFDLGNHLYSHADVNELSVQQIEQEITRGEATIVPLLKSVSRKPEFLRFPYNHTGDTKEKHDAVAAFISARGYRLAPCTIDNSDYLFNSTYVLALARHDDEAAARVRADYIAYTGMEIDWYTRLNKQVFGYEPPHIMLLHDNQLNADTIDEVISLFIQRGYTFVTLAEATRDLAYAVPETDISRNGPMWGYRWARELHVTVNGRDEPDPPAWIDQYAKDHGDR